jgi:hypothetical protein
LIGCANGPLCRQISWFLALQLILLDRVC